VARYAAYEALAQASGLLPPTAAGGGGAAASAGGRTGAGRLHILTTPDQIALFRSAAMGHVPPPTTAPSGGGGGAGGYAGAGDTELDACADWQAEWVVGGAAAAAAAAAAVAGAPATTGARPGEISGDPAPWARWESPAGPAGDVWRQALAVAAGVADTPVEPVQVLLVGTVA
jgi:hypothetical protein